MADLEQYRDDRGCHDKLQTKKHCHNQESRAKEKHHRQCTRQLGRNLGRYFLIFSMDTPPFFFCVKILYIFYDSAVWRH